MIVFSMIYTIDYMMSVNDLCTLHRTFCSSYKLTHSKPAAMCAETCLERPSSSDTSIFWCNHPRLNQIEPVTRDHLPRATISFLVEELIFQDSLHHTALKPDKNLFNITSRVTCLLYVQHLEYLQQLHCHPASIYTGGYRYMYR